jgi:signal transduction histidine kinase
MTAVPALAAAAACVVALAALVALRHAAMRSTALAGRLAAAQEELAAAQRAIATQERLSSLGMLAAGVAHEINNPMSYVTANLEALTQDLARISPLPRVLSDYVDDILPATLDGVERVNAIVADLRSFSREDPGAMCEFDLNAQVEAALRIANGSLRHRAQVVTQLGRLPPAIGKPQQIAQVLVNLLVNAAQAIPQWGTVTVSTRTHPDEFLVEVRDTGVGMDAETLRRLFTPFFTTKPVGEGTGLGLAVANGIVRSHGGRITVRSTPGAGSVFSVHLPRVPPTARRARPGSPQQAA